MINEKETKLIKKHCIFSYIAIGSMIVPLLLLIEWIFLEMIDEIVFHNDKSNSIIIKMVLGLIIIYFIVSIYFLFRNLIERQGEKWKTIQRNSCLPSEKTKNADVIAKRYDIKIPRCRLFILWK